MQKDFDVTAHGISFSPVAMLNLTNVNMKSIAICNYIFVA